MSHLTESAAIAAGHTFVLGIELRKLMLNHTCRGVYRGGFRFITYVDEKGKMEGRNHVGAHDFGVCEIDEENHTCTVIWENGWDGTTTRAYQVGDELRFYDVDSGDWRNTMTRFELGRHGLDI